MVHKIILALLMCLAGAVAIGNPEPIQITIVYDNETYDPRLIAQWGFSCFVEGLEKSILFDTGGDGAVLLSNLEELDIVPQDVEMVFLSHRHWDHVGGVEAFLSENPDVDVFIPQSILEKLKISIEAAGATCRAVEDSVAVCKNAFSTGELGDAIAEHSLVIKTPEGLVVITGCAHPGIVEILRTAKSLFKQDIYLVLGGFHLGGRSDTDIERIIHEFRNLGVERIAPSHCTGERALELFEAEYGKDFVKLGVGARISIE